jgi:hypothetical protein
MKNEYWRFKTRARRKEEIKIYEKYLVIYISIKRLERSVISSFNGSVLRATGYMTSAILLVKKFFFKHGNVSITNSGNYQSGLLKT